MQFEIMGFLKVPQASVEPWTLYTWTEPPCRKDLHRSNFGFSNSQIPAALVGSAVGKPLRKPKIDFYDPFSLYVSDLYELN